MRCPSNRSRQTIQSLTSSALLSALSVAWGGEARLNAQDLPLLEVVSKPSETGPQLACKGASGSLRSVLREAVRTPSPRGEKRGRQAACWGPIPIAPRRSERRVVRPSGRVLCLWYLPRGR